MGKLTYDPNVDVLHILQVHTEDEDFTDADKYIRKVIEDLNTDQCAYDNEEHQLIYVHNDDGIMAAEDIMDMVQSKYIWFEPIC